MALHPFIPPEAKAAMGLALLKEAILTYLAEHPEGLRNNELSQQLGLETDHQGNQENYLTYSVLGLLLKEQRVDKVKNGRATLYVLRG
jgi:hypothetical protein